ncbi:MAG TPA: hypothetical protein VN540_01455 [Clostridia bacterium]|nr:hypothetical protein [Clostridia bacterium]
MKRMFPIVAAVMFCLIFAACTGDAAPTGAFSEKDLGIGVGDGTYYLREDSAPLVEALGTDCEYSAQVSCVYDGEDKTFEYAGITVETVPVDGKDVIEVITLTDDAYATLRGAKVGDTLDEVKALYGDAYFDDGYLTYSLNNDASDIHAERIQFEYADNVVTRIFIYSPSY